MINKIDARESTFYRATCLTERGIEDAKLLGKIFKHANVKISKISGFAVLIGSFVLAVIIYKRGGFFL